MLRLQRKQFSDKSDKNNKEDLEKRRKVARKNAILHGAAGLLGAGMSVSLANGAFGPGKVKPGELRNSEDIDKIRREGAWSGIASGLTGLSSLANIYGSVDNLKELHKIKKELKKQKDYSDPDLEDYEVLDDKKIKGLTENQIQMLLEDERAKARRNTARIVGKHSKEGAEEGAVEGKKRGKKSGTIAGSIVGALGGAAAGYGIGDSIKRAGGKGALIGGLGGALAGAGLGRLVGGSAGEASGREEGRRKGAAKGLKISKEQGHDADEKTLKNARSLDDYARRHKKEDRYERDFRNKLLEEKADREKKAAAARAEQRERERVEAEKRRAEAEERRSRTDRDRYYDEHYGWGQYSRDRQGNGGTSYTQNNYYR